MIYGYARVSTDVQDLTSQLAQLKAAGTLSTSPASSTNRKRLRVEPKSHGVFASISETPSVFLGEAACGRERQSLLASFATQRPSLAAIPHQ
jgi:hypothetical protein